MSAEPLLIVAVILQIAAAVLAFRLVKVTGRRLAWILISCALVLMAVRRLLPLYYLVSGQAIWIDPLNEAIGMLLSGFMLAGVALIGPIFGKIFAYERELRQSEQRFRSYFELPIVGVAILAPDFRWNTVNDRICEMLGRSREELLDRPVRDLTFPEDGERESLLQRQILAGKASGYSLDKRFRRKGRAEPVWANQAIRCVRKGDGDIDYFVTIIQDISDRKDYEESLRVSMNEKDALLRELYHRTKNNMQVICSLMNLEGSSFDDPRLAEGFHVIENRIYSMSLVHEKLYQSKDLSSIYFDDYVQDLARLLIKGYCGNADRIRLVTELERIQVPIDCAIPCGMILNELVTNSLKHGFPDQGSGTILVRLARDGDGMVRLEVEDDGVGIGTGSRDGLAEGVGLKTVRTLAEQIGGELRHDGTAGTKWSLAFALEPSGVGDRMKGSGAGKETLELGETVYR